MPIPDHIDRLKEGVDSWNTWRDEHPELEKQLVEAREHARPILISYDLPGVVYALGHPAPLVRGRERIVE